METNKKQKLIISFDVGVKNLSCCVLNVLNVATNSDSSAAQVVIWRILALAEEKEKVPSIQECSGRLFMALDELVDELEQLGFTHIDQVLIENQPSKLNGTMKSIQMMIYAYFQLRRHWEGKVSKTDMVSASQKLLGHAHAIPECPTKTGYALNKWKAVRYCECYISGDTALGSMFQGYKKKDDLADSMLQALSWMRKHKMEVDKVTNYSAYETT
jgi:hypothetical protein